MKTLNVTFLGTGNAVPTEKRNHTSILVNLDSENIMIDCGEGTQRQLRTAKISPTKITRLLITHWHGDHILGIPGLLQTLAMSEYSKTLYIYGPKGTYYFMEALEKFIGKFKIPIKIQEVSGKFLETKDFYIEAAAMNHDAPCNAYSIVVKEKIRLDRKKLKKLKLPNSPLLGQLQQGKDINFNGRKIKASAVTYKEKGKKITFILDTAMNENAAKLSSNSELLVCESTFANEDEKQALEYKHLTSAQAATIAKKSKSKLLYLTHISQRYEHNTSIIEKQAKKIFKNTKIPKDLDKISV